ncbi:DUF805 domain-containing protein [Paenirhodobacter enshiensis]|uniref:DUF805 domain-containing protein n=1 Tax=Paenirhodobacter enshiensis TaxID=1105367 RepID=UPI0013777A93|nr:DUF805 domain-containing protein [Paenirhodobacter enshiensis]
MTEWYYAVGGDSRGPVPETEIAAFIRTGMIRPDTLVWREGMTGWEPARGHLAFGQTPPAPPRQPAVAYASRTGTGPAPALGFGEAISQCLRRYATFRGRASRSEYWYFYLFIVLGSFVAGLLDKGLAHNSSAAYMLFAVATFLPNVAVTVRRLHDTDRSGWWLGGWWLAAVIGGAAIGLSAVKGQSGAIVAVFAAAILVYGLALLVFMCQRGTPGPNRFD